MRVVIEATPDEIAALVVAVQKRQWSKEDLVAKLNEILMENIEAHKDLQYT